MKFVTNPNIERELDRMPGLIAQKRAAAEQVKRFAIGAAPVNTGDYAQSIHVVNRGGETYVRTNDFAGHMVEYGSVNNPPYAPIRRAVRAAGLRLEEKSN